MEKQKRNMIGRKEETMPSSVKPLTPAQLHRKIHKPLMEKKRRQRINDCLLEIKSLIMDAGDENSGQSKLEKADLLEMTVEYLRTLKQRDRPRDGLDNQRDQEKSPSTVLPGHQPGNHHDHPPGTHPVHQPGLLPGNEPTSHPDHQPGNHPGHQHGQLPGHPLGNHHDHQPGTHHVHQAGQLPGHQPDSYPGHQPGNQPGNHPGHQPSTLPGSQHGKHSGHQPDTHPGSQHGKHSGHQPGNHPGKHAGHLHGRISVKECGNQNDNHEPINQPANPSTTQSGNQHGNHNKHGDQHAHRFASNILGKNQHEYENSDRTCADRIGRSSPSTSPDHRCQESPGGDQHQTLDEVEGQKPGNAVSDYCVRTEQSKKPRSPQNVQEKLNTSVHLPLESLGLQSCSAPDRDWWKSGNPDTASPDSIPRYHTANSHTGRDAETDEEDDDMEVNVDVDDSSASGETNAIQQRMMTAEDDRKVFQDAQTCFLPYFGHYPLVFAGSHSALHNSMWRPW